VDLAAPESVWVGRQPAVLILDGAGDLVGVWSLVLGAGQVSAVHGMVNPEKLDHLGIIPITEIGPA
jgi:hypothetical protein